MTSERRALGQASLAYTWWGASAIFWNELGSVAPIDQLAWRVLTACLYLTVGGVFFAKRLQAAGIEASLFTSSTVRAYLTTRHIAYGVSASLMIAANWALFLWAVSNDQAVEAALGYFLMPILTVALGVGLLGERLRVLQVGALVLCVIGIGWTIVVVGRLPLIALSVAATFALYGLLRKQGPWDAISGLTFETGILVPLFLVILVVRGVSGEAIFGDGSTVTPVLIVLTGVVTMVPLIAFASASKRVSLSILGLLQYINPTLQFFVGWQVLGEVVQADRLIGFGWIWAALVLIVVDEVLSQRPVDGGVARSDERLVHRGERLTSKEPSVRRER